MQQLGGWFGRYKTTRHIQVLNVLEAVAQIAEERVPQMLQHASLADYISYTL